MAIKHVKAMKIKRTLIHHILPQKEYNNKP